MERQLALIRAYAAERGLHLDEELVFRDNGRSAWQKPGGPPPHRPRWDAMIAAGRAGRFGGLLTWKIDRFARNTRDGADLADLGVLLDGPESGADRPAHRGRAGEVPQPDRGGAQRLARASEKVEAAFADMLASGYRVGGSGRLFGFEMLSQAEIDWGWDDEDGRFAGPAAVVREDEAEIIGSWPGGCWPGETVQAMADWLNERGITTTRGGEWEPRNLSRTLGNPLYGGQLAYKGQIVGRLANVEPIMDGGTYEAVQAKLTGRRRGRRGRGVPAVRVAVCGNPACGRQGHDVGAKAGPGRPGVVCARPTAVRPVCHRPGRGEDAECRAGCPGRRGGCGRRRGPPTPPWTSSGAS